MTSTDLPAFLNHLECSKLLSHKRLQKLREKLTESATAHQTAERLVAARYLTQWQARQLLKGETGFVIGKYRLMNPVGRGGMGHVFRAVDTTDNSIVAVKVMARALTKNQTLVSRFQREIRATQQLNHPHIVKTLDAGRVGKIDFMVMEYVNGDQLDKIVNHYQRLPVNIACEVIRQIAVGLQHATEKGMVHRDIKPANMMIDWDESGTGTVKLMDMGLVLLTSDSSDEKTVTRAGQVMGTPDYMSPEQGWDTSKVDLRSDIYSLGCALFRFLTGTIPFTGSNPLQVLSQRLQRDAPSVTSISSDLPQKLADVVSKMTRRDPDARYQSPQDVVTALAPFCRPILRSELEALPTDAQDSGQDSFASADQTIDETDGTYRRFLQEVQAGTSIDLIDDFVVDQDVQETDHTGAETVPIVKISPQRATSRRVSRSNQRQTKFGLLILAISAIVVIVLGALVIWKINSTDQEVTNTGSSNSTAEQRETNTERDRPPLQFVSTDVFEAVAGTIFEHQPQVTGNDDRITYQLASSAPVDAKIDQRNAAISWKIRRNQTPDTYQLKIEAVDSTSADRIVVAESTVEVQVIADTTPLPVPDRLIFNPLPAGTRTILPVSNIKLRTSDRNIEYSLLPPFPAELQIDRKNGVLAWTPQVADIGRHELTLVYRDIDTDSVSHRPFRLVVVPTNIEHVLPPIPALTAVAGTTFQYRLPKRIDLPKPKRMDAGRTISLGSGAPSDCTLKQNLIEWKIPANVTGEIKIPLRASWYSRNKIRPMPLQGQQDLTIFVSPPAKPAPTAIPSAGQLKTATLELKKTYERAISKARTPEQKNELAARLLTESDSETSGIKNYARLQFVQEELANKTRNIFALFEIARLKSARYGQDEIQLALQATKLFRRSNASDAQQSLVLERTLNLAADALQAERYDEISDLLQFALSVLGRPTNNMTRTLAGDLKAARKLSPNSQATDVAELSRLLQRWQFQPMFVDSSTVMYAVITANNQTTLLEDSGRSLWTMSDNQVKLKGPLEPILVAAINSQKLQGNYVLRFDVAPDTNCLQLLLGGTDTDAGAFDALRLVLQKEGFGRLGHLNDASPIVSAAAARMPTLKMMAWNHVEIAVTGGAVVLLVNGDVVFNATDFERPIEGMVGIVANLQSQNAKLTVRNPRFLVLP